MEWFITALVFIGYMFAMLLCLVAVIGGVYLAVVAYKRRRQIVEEAKLEHTKSGYIIYFKGTGGILLAIAGIVGCCFIVYHYWKVLLVLPFLAGGGETARRHRKSKRSKKKTRKKKVAKRKLTKKKMPKKKMIKEKYR
jgi:uncharacterized membrane protein